MRRFSRREQKIVYFFLATVLIAVVFTWCIKPLNSKLKNIKQKKHVLQRKITKKTRAMRQSKSVDKNYEKYINDLRQQGTNEEVMSKIVSEIEEVAGDISLRISELKPMRVKKSDFINQFSVSLTIDSNFEEVIEFIHILQSKPHLFNVEELKFNKGSRAKVKSIKSRLVLGKMFIPK